MYQHRDETLPQSVRNRLRRKKVRVVKRFVSRTLGVFFITLGVLLAFGNPVYAFYHSVSGQIINKNSIDRSAQISYNSDPIKIADKLLSGNQSEELYPVKVIIPQVNIDVTVRPAKVVDGKWEVFDDMASYGIGSSIPGLVGNTVISAHAKDNYFLNLKKVELSDNIYVFTNNDWYEYQVIQIKEVLPTDTSVIEQTTDETLTLYTCSGYADSKRLIVVAKRS